MKTIHLAQLFVPLLLLTPLIIYDAAMDQVMHPRFLYLSCLLSITFLLLLYTNRDKKLTINWLDIIFGSFYAINLLSILMAPNKAEALFETQKVFLTLGTYGILRVFFNDNPSRFIPFFLKAMIILSLILSGYSIKILGDIYTEFGALYHSTVYAIKGLFAHKNLLSAFLLFLLAFNVWGSIALKQIWKGLSIFNIISILSLIFLLQTRAAYLGTFIFLLTMFVGIMSSATIRQQLPIKKIALGALAVLGISVGALTVTGNIAGPFKRLTSFGQTNSVKERTILWQKSVELMKDYPLLGVGNGNWKLMYTKYSVTGLRRAETEDIQFIRPHNDYLWIGSETGFIGLLLFLGLAGLAIIALISAIRKADSAQEAIPAWSILAGILAYLVVSVFDFPRERLEHQMLWACYLALTVYMGQHFFTNRQYTLGVKAKFILIPIILLSIFTAYMGYSRLQSELIVKQMISNTQRNKWQKVKRQSLQAHTMFYNMDLLTNPLVWWEAIADFRDKKYQEANQKFQEALDIHPNSHKVFNNLGSSYYVLQDYENAEKAYRQSLVINPKYDEALGNMVRLYLRGNNPAKARTYLEQMSKESDRKKQLTQMLEQLEKS